MTSIEPWEQEIPLELVPVRAGEELAWDRLERYLRPELELADDAPAMTVLAVPQRLGQPDVPAQLRRAAVRPPPSAVRA